MTHDIGEIKTFISEQKNFYITGHINPDGDSIGSCFGLGLALEKLGKNVHVFMEPFHFKYDVIPGKHLMWDGIEQPTPDSVLICVDCADIGRLSDRAKELAETLPYSICIDHHYTNTNFAMYNFVDGTASSACEMVYRLLDSFVDLNHDIASALYAGMVSDTGGFRHAATSQDTLDVASKLMSLGIPFTEIYTELVHLRSFTEVKLLARILNSCSCIKDGQVVYACVSQEMMQNFENAPDATSQDLEGVVEILLNIRNARVSLLVYERDTKEVKISLRSRSVNVGAIAQHFGGGGHTLAAGATIKGQYSVFEVKDKILLLILEALN
ncbi:MAG: bifunctional oligoribonuclease/PAP phosphatase NrnA [Defluviitaleaceae bacterium]|nr:bifunctional oligoribonuclease/PAP phosphatase NrnA [Defluviitaleaceae bacterium]